MKLTIHDFLIKQGKNPNKPYTKKYVRWSDKQIVFILNYYKYFARKRAVDEMSQFLLRDKRHIKEAYMNYRRLHTLRVIRLTHESVCKLNN